MPTMMTNMQTWRYVHERWECTSTHTLPFFLTNLTERRNNDASQSEQRLDDVSSAPLKKHWVKENMWWTRNNTIQLVTISDLSLTPAHTEVTAHTHTFCRCITTAEGKHWHRRTLLQHLAPWSTHVNPRRWRFLPGHNFKPPTNNSPLPPAVMDTAGLLKITARNDY